MRLSPLSARPVRVCLVLVAMLLALVPLLPGSALAASPQLSGSPASVVFGTVLLGQKQTEVVALTNAGKTSMTISSVTATGSAFSVSGVSLPQTLAAGGSMTLKVTFSPAQTGWDYGSLGFTSTTGPSLKIPLAGAGGKLKRLQASPASVSFGNVKVETTATIPVVVTNERSSSLTMTALRTFGPGVSASGLVLPATLSPGESATIDISFTPQRVGLTGGSVLVEGASLNIPFTGTGTNATTTQLSIVPTSVNFGDVALGASTTDTVTMTAAGGSVTISSASSSNAQFEIPGASFPLTINAGQSLPLKLSFTPKGSGKISANFTFTSDATDAHVVEAVSGTGTAPSVTLSWSPSTSPVSGYNIYRGASPGAYTRVNSKVDPATTYTDVTVLPGTTYYYAATAVNSRGEESGYSVPILVAIP